MEHEPQISFRGLDPTPDILDVIKDKIAKLEQVHNRITSCRVIVEQPHQKGTKGHIHHVSIEIEVPTGRVIVNRKPGDVNAHEDLRVALRDSFNTARRQLLGQLHRHDPVQVKSHPEKAQGTVVDVFPTDGFGFLETPGGEELYFQRDSMATEEWDDISVGSTLHFSRMDGEKGPYAVNLSLRS
ncbi:HPF/RaiA family ribosome-associated protein [Arenibacterium sp. CAU 1754]